MTDPDGSRRATVQRRSAARGRALGAALTLGVLAAACAAPLQELRPPYDRPYQVDPPRTLHPIPASFDPSDWVEGFYNDSFLQIARLVSPGYHLERYAGGPAALDVNAFGKVPDSVWFENRAGRVHLTPEQVFVGPDTTAGPAPGLLSITKAKIEGVTPGFFLKDSAGGRWLVKFDVPAFPEMNSAAEVISTKLLYAVGYHVPENHVGRFRREDLSIAPGATMNDRYNRTVPFTRERLDELLDRVESEPDGRVRAMFSRFVSGRPVGPFPLQGVRDDDPNDRIPHERRRSLRGLWVFYAWLNDTDAKVANGLDAFVEVDAERRLGYLRHYLIDFGSSLGSLGHGPKLRSDGYEYNVDWERIALRTVTLGVLPTYWEGVRRTRFRGVGVLESDVFDPARWRPQYPNPAFDSADWQDTFWAAAILAHVPREAIEAAVRAGELTEDGAAPWVSHTLEQRRDKLLRYAFSGHAPLDDPMIRTPATLEWTDLERLAGLPEAARAHEWRLVWTSDDGARFERRGRTSSTRLRLDATLDALRRQHDRALARRPFIEVRLRKAADGATDAPWLTVQLRLCENGELVAVGLERQ